MGKEPVFNDLNEWLTIMKNIALPVTWAHPFEKDIGQILRNGFLKKQSVEIDYVGEGQNGSSKKSHTVRLVDIHALNGGSFEGYCHLRRAQRTFKIDQVLAARLTERTYRTKSEAQHVLF